MSGRVILKKRAFETMHSFDQEKGRVLFISCVAVFVGIEDVF